MGPSLSPKPDKWNSENRATSSFTTYWTCQCPSSLLGTSWAQAFLFLSFHRESAARNRFGDRPVPPAHHGRQGEHAVQQRGAERGPADGQRRATGGAQDVHQWHHPGRLPRAQSTWRPPAFRLSHQSRVFMAQVPHLTWRGTNQQDLVEISQLCRKYKVSWQTL